MDTECCYVLQANIRWVRLDIKADFTVLFLDTLSCHLLFLSYHRCQAASPRIGQSSLHTFEPFLRAFRRSMMSPTLMSSPEGTCRLLLFHIMWLVAAEQSSRMALEYGQLKNRWPIVSSSSPQRTHREVAVTSQSLRVQKDGRCPHLSLQRRTESGFFRPDA